MRQLILCSIYIIIFSNTLIVFAQENKEEQAAAQQKWMEYMTPSSTHKMMAKSVGEWTTHMEMWSAPGTESMKSDGVCKS